MAGKVYNSPGVALFEHQQSADTITGGQLKGIVKAFNNTEYATGQVRNIFLSTSAPTSNQGNDGDIWIRYSN